MHYDGTDVDPGEDLSLGNHDLGQATYDSDGDGVADSYIAVQSNGQVAVATDMNHDGTVDTVSFVNPDGSVEIHDAAGATIGAGHLVDGHIVVDQGSMNGGDTNGSNPVPAPGPGPAPAGGDITVSENGQTQGLGAPNIDVNQDGKLDGVAVQAADGTQTVFYDQDGNGTVDAISQVHPDGTAVIAGPDGHGGWVVTAAGHVQDGQLVNDPNSPEVGQSFVPPAVSGAGTDATGPGATGTDTTVNHPTGPGATGTDTTVNHPTGPGTTGTTGTPAGDISLTVGGNTHDLGAATQDSNNDGVKDTTIVQTKDGNTLVATDIDGNGTADQVIDIAPDGSATVLVADSNGTWETVATGHVDSSGQLVIDKKQ